MEKMILFLLVLMVIEQALGIAYNFTTRAQNERTNQDNAAKANEQLSKLQDQLARANLALRVLQLKRPSPAFLITEEGIKSLPEGWEMFFDKSWGITQAETDIAGAAAKEV